MIQRVAVKLAGATQYGIMRATKLYTDATHKPYLAYADLKSWNVSDLQLIRSVFLLPVNDSIYLERIVDKIDLQNASNTTQILEMYELFIRKPGNDISDTPHVLFTNGLSDQGLSIPAIDYPVFTPFDVKAFTEVFKINRVRKITLRSGDRKQLQFTRNIGKKYSYTYAAENATIFNIPAITKYYMFFSYGTPTQDETTLTNVSNYGVDVNITHFTKAYFRIVQVSQYRTRSTDSRPVVDEPQVMVNPYANTRFHNTTDTAVPTVPLADPARFLR